MIASTLQHRASTLAVALALILAAAPAAFAASASTSLAVSANVANNCTISTSSLAFGPYDPIVANATAVLDAAGSVTITCTKGAATTIGLDAGLNAASAIGTTRAMASAGNFLSYEIFQDAGRTTVWGNAGAGLFTPPAAPSKAPRSFAVNGRIPAAQDVPAGAYSDTVQATVNF